MLAGSSPAEELGEGGGGQAIGRDRGEEGEHRQALAEVEVLRLLEEASVPAQRSAVVLLEVPISKEEGCSSASARLMNWSSDAADSASVTLPQSSAWRKRM